MSQKDWEKVQKIIKKKSSKFLEKFLISNEIFLPNPLKTSLFSSSTTL